MERILDFLENSQDKVIAICQFSLAAISFLGFLIVGIHNMFCGNIKSAGGYLVLILLGLMLWCLVAASYQEMRKELKDKK